LGLLRRKEPEAERTLLCYLLKHFIQAEGFRAQEQRTIGMRREETVQFLYSIVSVTGKHRVLGETAFLPMVPTVRAIIKCYLTL
jgi:hypothetical protein